MIKLQDYLTSSGKYPERASKADESVINSAIELLERVSDALEYLDVDIGSLEISSGYRPPDVNKNVPNAATRSAHMSGEALDLLDDKNQTLCKLFTRDILELFDLYREDSDYTRGKYANWCHLQIRPTRSGKRIFKP